MGKLVANIADANILKAVSQWDSKEHYDTYLKWRTETGAIAALLESLDEEPVFRFLPVEQEY